MSDKAQQNSVLVFLSDKRPVRVSETAWPVVSRASENVVLAALKGFKRFTLTVRAHAAPGAQEPFLPHEDQRCYVTGSCATDWTGAMVQAGYETTLDDSAAALRKVGAYIGAKDELIDWAISFLPERIEQDQDQQQTTPLTAQDRRGEVVMAHQS
jgi:hypothetical protein